MIELFDSHCHIYNRRVYKGEFESVLSRMQEANVKRCMLAAMNVNSSDAIVDFIGKHEGMYGAVGVHPHYAGSFDENRDIPHFIRLLRKGNVSAIGEIGLDYYRDLSPRHVQKQVCQRLLFLADEFSMPVIIHVRDAHEDMLDLLHALKRHLHGGVIHCFSAGWKEAQEYLSLGMHISFSCSVLREDQSMLRETVKRIPSERILMETDSPFLPPPHSEMRHNEPCNIRFVAEAIADLRGITVDEVAKITTKNAIQLFKIM